MSGSDSCGLFLCLREQKAQIEPTQTQESFVAAICPVKAMAMTMLETG